ncbi:MAG TPA: hypothetical protein VFB32_13320 [Rudaea sp.]|nr:hypothetical protein [Rudaea sp.]
MTPLRLRLPIAPRAWLVLAGLMALTALVYWPSLSGGFIFDDRYYIESPNVHVTTTRLADWVRAALSQAGTNQFRALTSLSFAANYYFTGLDPYWLKLTNLVIHLANGWALFLMLRELFALWRTTGREDFSDRRDQRVAALIAGAWLLLPINLTGVAYVSQRFESLANVFVLLGLFSYLRTRRRLFLGHGGGASLGIGLAAFLVLGVSAKESAALLPLFTLCADVVLTRLRNRDGTLCRPAVAAHLVFLVLPLIAGLVWLSLRVFTRIEGVRTFTTGERLLTEARVLVDYLHWTLLPNLDDLTFYHDDIAVSKGLLEPPATLASILALLALAGVALWQWAARPLFCLGVVWFFAGHALTATIIPLELVFEHRNYFPSIGLLLAVAALLTLEPVRGLPRIRVPVTLGFLVLFAFVTHLRAEEWSNPLRLAYAEALKRPQSPRAQYELADTLIRAAGSDANSPLLSAATTVLERSALAPASGIAPLQALIYLSARQHRPLDPRWWPAIVAKLQAAPPSQTDIDSLVFLFRCQERGDCPVRNQELFDAFTAALTQSHGNLYLASAYGEFAFRELHDADLAERMFRDVVAQQPSVPVYRANLIRLLIATGQFDRAAAEISALEKLNTLGSLDTMISELHAEMSAAQARTAPTAPEVATPRP